MKIIAELCQNHNGDFSVVRKMLKTAASAGATHAKIQHIYGKNLVYRPVFENGLTEDGVTRAIKRPWAPEHKRLSSLELDDSECRHFVELCESLEMVPMTTCFTRGDVERIHAQGFRSVKVASYDCASFPMLRELAQRFDHIYVSTGATFDQEVEHAAFQLSQGAAKFSMLHCVTQYPTPLELTNLNRMVWLRQFASEVGFSDHSLVEEDQLCVSKVALWLGADIVERHFTMLSASETRDGPVSITVEQLCELSRFARLSREDQLAELEAEYPDWRIATKSVGTGMTDSEMLNRDYYRGRFATPRRAGATRDTEMIFNWEETPL